MKEQIKEYLTSTDEDVVYIGLELLKQLDISFEEKQVLLTTNQGRFIVRETLIDSISPSGIYFTNNAHQVRHDEKRQFSSPYTYLGTLEEVLL